MKIFAKFRVPPQPDITELHNQKCPPGCEVNWPCRELAAQLRNAERAGFAMLESPERYFFEKTGQYSVLFQPEDYRLDSGAQEAVQYSTFFNEMKQL